jgi:uncharacterized membrane protein
MRMIWQLFLKYKFIIIVFAFGVLSGFNLLHQGLPPTHDGEYHVVRFYEFDQVLRSGVLYPRWAPDLNYGYGIPLFNYVYPLPNYASSILHFFGLSFIDSFKAGLFIAVLLASIFFYLWAKIFFGEKGGLTGAFFYLFSPYLFVDIFVRGSVGEAWAIAFFPAFLWAITKLILRGDKKFFVLSIVFLSLVIFSHNILAIMFFPFAIFYSIFIIYVLGNKNIKKILPVALVFVLSLGLSSIFWLPAILETKYVVGLQVYDYTRNFPEIYQLIFPSWGSGFFGGGLTNEMSTQIGVANLTGVVLSIFALFKLKKKNQNKKIIAFFLAFFFLVVFLMLKQSIPIWENVPFMNYFQFPWRLLSLTMLICAFLTAGVSSLIKSKIFVFVLMLLAFVLTINYNRPAYYIDRNDDYYISRPNFMDGTNSIGNSFNTIWFKAEKERSKQKISLNNDRKAEAISLAPTSYSFNLTSSQSSALIINTAYFPGWQAKIDGKSTPVGISDKGLIQINVPDGRKHLIKLAYAGTNAQMIAFGIVLISLALTIIISTKKWYII